MLDPLPIFLIFFIFSHLSLFFFTVLNSHFNSLIGENTLFRFAFSHAGQQIGYDIIAVCCVRLPGHVMSHVKLMK